MSPAACLRRPSALLLALITLVGCGASRSTASMPPDAPGAPDSSTHSTRERWTLAAPLLVVVMGVLAAGAPGWRASRAG